MPSKIPFEEMLAQSLERVEQGESIDYCLARYPADAPALEPLLRVAITLRYSPQPELGPVAFAQGRHALAAFARHQQALRRPLVNTPKPAPLQQRLPASPADRLPAPTLAGRQWGILRYASLVVSLFLLVSLAMLLRSISISLPGGSFYRVKLLSENMQGVFSLAAGDRAAWFARQSERRLQEAFQLTQQQQAVTPELLQAIDENLQATLAATADIPADQRNDFLLAWLGRLQQLEAGAPVAQPGVETLHQAITQLEAAISSTALPTVVPLVSLPASSPVPSVTAELTITLPAEAVINAMPTPTPDLLNVASAGPESLATPTEVPTLAEIKTLPPTATVLVATLAPTATPQDFDNAVAQPSNGGGGGGGSSNGQSENLQPKPTQVTAPNSVPNTPTWTPTSVVAVVAPMPTLTETQAITTTPTGVASGTGTATATRDTTITPTDERTPTPAATSGTGTATPITTATETPTPTERPTETPSFTLEPTGITPVTPAGTDIPTPVSSETPTPEEFFTVTPTHTPQATEVATPTEVATEYTREPTWTPAETVTPTEEVATETPTPQATNPPEPTAAPTSETPAPATKPGRQQK